MRDPYSRENLTRQHEDELALAQRAGKQKRTKAIHAKIKNKRKDWAHKVTTALARRAKRIVVGDVSSTKASLRPRSGALLAKTKLAKTKLAKSTYDAAWASSDINRPCKDARAVHYKAIRLAGDPLRAGGCVPGREVFSSVTCSARPE